MDNLSASLLWCNALYIAIASLDFFYTSSNSLPFHCSICTPYLNTATGHPFIASFFCFFFSFNQVIMISGFYALTYIPLLFFLSFHFIIFTYLLQRTKIANKKQLTSKSKQIKAKTFIFSHLI